MQTLIYDGSFEGWLTAVFDVYEYRFSDVVICTEENFRGTIFEKIHRSQTDEKRSLRVWKGLEKKLTPEAQRQVYYGFLSEIDGMENTLLNYVQYAFSSTETMVSDFSHPSVLTVVQTARKVWREKHRMEAFVRFQKTKDGLYFAPVEPDHNVLPLLSPHFESRYADQCWVIYDTKRGYGIHYDLHSVKEVTIDLLQRINSVGDLQSIVDEQEEIYQQLWQRYFKTVSIAARKNTKLHQRHMPRRYWKFLTEKRPG